MADPTGERYFGRALWRVPDADVLRYRVCREIAEAALADRKGS